MTPKQQFLDNIQKKIKMLQQAYDANKDLPDDLFQIGATPTVKAFSIGATLSDSVNKATQALRASSEILIASNALTYGDNKKMVRELLERAGRPVPKSTLIDQLIIKGYTDQDAYKIVTNSLAAMSTDKEVVGQKPEGQKMKGLYWSLAKTKTRQTTIEDLENDDMLK